MPPESKPIWEGFYTEVDGVPHLVGSRCPGCSLTLFPRRALCPQCFGEMQAIPLSRRGKLETFTTVQVAPPGFSAPYTLGQLILPEKTRVFSMLAGERFNIGMEMELVIDQVGKDEQGNPLLGYKFRPRSEER